MKHPQIGSYLKTLSAATVAFAILGISAHAQIKSYSDYATWNAAAGPTIVETFNTSAEVPYADTSMNTPFGPIGYNGFSVSGTSNGNSVGITIGSLDLATGGDNTPIPSSFTGQNFLGWGEINGGTGPTITLTFTNPTTSVGFDWFNTDQTDEYSVTTAPGGNVYVAPPFSEAGAATAASGFFGLISATPLTSITIKTSVSGGYISTEGLDNVRVGVAPEPRPVAFLLLSFALLTTVRKFRVPFNATA